jgi:hypothetical protein
MPNGQRFTAAPVEVWAVHVCPGRVAMLGSVRSAD